MRRPDRDPSCLFAAILASGLLDGQGPGEPVELVPVG